MAATALFGSKRAQRVSRCPMSHRQVLLDPVGSNAALCQHRDTVVPEFLQIAFYLFLKFFFSIFSLIRLCLLGTPHLHYLNREDQEHFLIKAVDEEKPVVDLLDVS